MSILNILKKMTNNKPLITKEKIKSNFSQQAYDNYNNAKIKEFTDKYDLSSLESIKSIPISEATKYTNVDDYVVYMPEQILNRKATEYKKQKNYDFAIECLRKSNELKPYSPYSYTREDYERLVDILILAKKFGEAKKEHKLLDEKYGTRLEELERLCELNIANCNGTEEQYRETVINPYIAYNDSKEEYYWLLENLPDIAPKSYSAYTRMKNIKSDNYKKIITEIKKKDMLLKMLSFGYEERTRGCSLM